MTALPERKQLLDFDPCGRAVCFDHRQSLCHICCVDCKGMKSDPQNQTEDDDDRVFILDTGVNRFMPQWDEQLLGPSNTLMIKIGYDKPPNPLTPNELHLNYCQDCELTWLEGNAGSEAALSHPSHHTHAHVYAGTNRSLVVFIDGACPFNGQELFTTFLSIGVYFGRGSPYNVSKCLDDVPRPSNQKAEIAAALEAMRHVRQNIEPTRRALIRNTLPRGSEDHRRDIRRFRLVIATDSSYLVECLSDRISKWSLTNGVYMNEKGRAITNSEGFMRLNNEVDALSRVGIQVVWYHVPREHNQEADRLAQAALSPLAGIAQGQGESVVSGHFTLAAKEVPNA
ncbi:hypothetical protein F5Y13DRAFT_162716 [Hypoxylon sp. FL1857]|nr:hypothetical protein F5Y13DRAFT_162716 [Hypoxylon sp. FL1857]